MTYGNKIIFTIFFISFLLITGCTHRNWSYELYDGYKLQSINNKVYLYKDDKKIEINDLDYDIKSFKFNSDVVCLQLSDNRYYMVYYVDGNIYGPFDKDSLEQSISSLSMTFDANFQDISELEGKKYE